MTEREKAIEFVLAVLRSPLGLMSKPTRDKITQLAQEHNITALDLIETATHKARNA